ncbi:hypothetical protein BA6E_125162 [Bacteroidales bacterium 6E]|nr:hypothetical protein BA6E_125162 [Bacteroidales bacterium 6E]
MAGYYNTILPKFGKYLSVNEMIIYCSGFLYFSP